MATQDKNSNNIANENLHPKTWLVYAKRQRCKHEQAIRELGFLNWTQRYVNFCIGDIVYIFFNTDEHGNITRNGSVKFKAKVTARDFPRQQGDATYWEPGAEEKTLTEPTYVLAIMEEYAGNRLSEAELRKYGFPRNRIQVPVYSNVELIAYIEQEFEANHRIFL